MHTHRQWRRQLTAPVLMLAAAIPATLAAQTTRPAVTRRPTEMRTSPTRTVAETAAIDSFRHRTFASPSPSHHDRYPQGVDVRWNRHPRATAYQLVRSWSATGPWVAATSRATKGDVVTQHIEGLLPGKVLYFRVVALSARDGRLAAIDSSNAAVAQVSPSIVGPNRDAPGFVHLALCNTTPQAAVTLAWHSVPGASGYRVLQAVAPPSGSANGFRDLTHAPVLPATVEAQQMSATVIVRDTVFSQHAVPNGMYDYAVEPMFRMLNDSQEVWATAYGAAVGGLIVPSSESMSCAPQ
ncbi:MAG TPA: hypothetical protein VFJ96_09540 [Gemmatimonadaceae bacterium]|nr:hypothetical protein [Gemmatimonadaceae bacterium]